LLALPEILTVASTLSAYANLPKASVCPVNSLILSAPIKSPNAAPVHDVPLIELH